MTPGKFPQAHLQTGIYTLLGKTLNGNSGLDTNLLTNLSQRFSSQTSASKMRFKFFKRQFP